MPKHKHGGGPLARPPLNPALSVPVCVTNYDMGYEA